MPPRSKNGPTTTSSAPEVETSEQERDETEAAPSEPTTGLGAIAPALAFVAFLVLLIAIGFLQR
jgi:hypothetical protein